MDLQLVLLEGFKTAISVFSSIFTLENLVSIAPFLVIGIVLALASEMVRSFFNTGIGQFALLIGLCVVAANVWIF